MRIKSQLISTKSEIDENNNIHTEHNYCKAPSKEPDKLNHKINWSELDYMIPSEYNFEVNPCYADDTNWASTLKERINQIKRETPGKLRKYNLFTNAGKTEEHTIEKDGDDLWKICKILGTLLDTEKDIQRRMTLSITAYNKYKDIYNNRILSITMKIRHYNAFILPILLYNCELWTLTTKLAKKINAFHRKQLRRIMKIRWNPNTKTMMSNKTLYKVTKQKELSSIIQIRRLRWLGHMCRLHDDTPAKKCINEFLRPVKKRIGRAPLTWIQIINEDLKQIGLEDYQIFDQQSLKRLNIYAADRQRWRKKTKNLMPNVEESASR